MLAYVIGLLGSLGGAAVGVVVTAITASRRAERLAEERAEEIAEGRLRRVEIEVAEIRGLLKQRKDHHDQT